MGKHTSASDMCSTRANDRKSHSYSFSLLSVQIDRIPVLHVPIITDFLVFKGIQLTFARILIQRGEDEDEPVWSIPGTSMTEVL